MSTWATARKILPCSTGTAGTDSLKHYAQRGIETGMETKLRTLYQPERKRFMKYIFSALISVILLASPSFSGSINGFITDDHGEPLGYANIVLLGTEYGAASSLKGYYVIKDIPAGEYTLRAMMLGHATEDRQVRVGSRDDQRIDILMKVQAIQTDEVTVTAERTRFENKVEVSRINLDLREIKSAPAFIESDVFRSLQLLPGISSQNDFSSALIVRGGSPDENLILLDGAEIYNPYHIGGIFSTFNADAISDAEFNAGGFAPEFGGRLSSVLQITTREGDSRNGRFFKNSPVGNYFDISHIRGEVNILSSKLLLEGPLYRGSWLLSGRRTYFDQLARIYYWAKDEPQEWAYHFGDLQLKITQKLGDRHQLSFSSFGGSDVLAFVLQPSSVNEVNFDWDWGNRTNSLKWRYVPNSTFLSETTVSSTDYLFDVDLSFAQIDSNGQKAETNILVNNVVKDISVRNDVTIFAGKGHQLKTGISLKYLEMALDYRLEGNKLFDISRKPSIFEAYVQDQWKINVRLSVQGGLRLSKYELHDRVYVQPRFGMKYNISSDTKFTFSTGHYNQFIFTTNDDNEILRVVDFWEPVPPELDAQSSWHYIAGLEQWIGEGFTFSLEGYYKPYDVVLDANPNNDPFDDSDDFIQGSGEAWGAEILLKRESGRLTGWIGYAYSRVKKEIDLNSDGSVSRDEAFYLKYDTPHRVNVLLNYSLNKKNSVSLTYVFQNGQRYTPVVGKVHQRAGFAELLFPYGELVTINGDINSATFPDYGRMDIGYVRNVQWGKVKGRIKVQIINVSNNFNVLLYNWNHRYSPSRVTAIGMFPVVPSFGMEFEL